MMDMLARLAGNELLLPGQSGKVSDERTLVGPDGQSLHILVRTLREGEQEPTINETAEYFDDLSYRQSLHVIDTGTIKISNKEHFWATYYRMSLIRMTPPQFYKKYCLYLNRVEYLLTALLCPTFSGTVLPTDQMIQESERVYDEIVGSFRTLSE